MKQLKLSRVAENDNTTFGVLLLDGAPQFVTAEDLWRENEKQISCIPTGKYVIRRHTSPKFGLCYAVDNVPNRSHILIHAGNTHRDTHGCILVGLQFGVISGESAILRSKDALTLLMGSLAKDGEASLEITSYIER